MKINWAYQIPRFHFDEAATGTGDASPGAAPAAPPAPSSTPEPGATSPPGDSSTPSSAEATPAPGSDPFAGLENDYDDLDAVVIDGAAPTDGAAPPKQEATPAPKTDPKAAQPGTSPAAPPAAPTAAPTLPAPSATSPASPGEQFVQAIQGLKQHGAELGEWAGQNLFKLSDEDAAALATNAEEVIPKLMGRTYQQAVIAAANVVQNFLPSMIQHGVEQHTARSTRAREALDEFYKSNPDLNAKDHGETVALWAKQFRATNPKASRADAIKFVGNAVRLQHGISAAPAASPAPKAQPFAPARPGGRVPAPPQQHDPFAGLDQDFDEG